MTSFDFMLSHQHVWHNSGAFIYTNKVIRNKKSFWDVFFLFYLTSLDWNHDFGLPIINYHREVSELGLLAWREVLRRIWYSVMCSYHGLGRHLALL